MTGQGHSFVRNALASYGVRGLRAVSMLLLTPYLFRELGLSGFGAWSVLFTLATIFSLIEYGATVGVTKYVAEYQAAGRERDIAVLVAGALAAMAWLGLIALLLTAVLLPIAAGLAPDGERSGFLVGLLLIGAAQLVRFPGQVFGAVLMGRQRYELYNASEALTLVSFVIGAVLALELGGGLAWLGGTFAASLVAGAVVNTAIARRLDPSLPLWPHRVPREVRARVVRFGSLSLLVDSMDFIAQRMDTLVVAGIRGAAAAAPIAAATRMISGVQALILPFVTLILPMIAELRAAGRREELIERYVTSTRVAMQVTLAAAGGLAIFSTDAVDVWLGPTAPAVTDPIVVILMVLQIIVLTAAPATKVLLGVGKLRAVTVLAVVEGVLNLALSIVLVIVWGAIGAAIATLVTSGLIVPARIPLACGAIGCPVPRLARSALLPALASVAPAVLVMVIVVEMMEPGLARLCVGLGAGWGIAIAIGLAQIGPRRLAARVARELARPRQVGEPVA